jgi:hypothetical protein
VSEAEPLNGFLVHSTCISKDSKPTSKGYVSFGGLVPRKRKITLLNYIDSLSSIISHLVSKASDKR